MGDGLPVGVHQSTPVVGRCAGGPDGFGPPCLPNGRRSSTSFSESPRPVPRRLYREEGIDGVSVAHPRPWAGEVTVHESRTTRLRRVYRRTPTVTAFSRPSCIANRGVEERLVPSQGKVVEAIAAQPTDSWCRACSLDWCSPGTSCCGPSLTRALCHVTVLQPCAHSLPDAASPLMRKSPA